MNCILCNRAEPFELIDELEFELADKPVLIRPVLCPDCGLVFLYPPIDPEILDEYYAWQNRYPSETAAYEEQVKMICKHFKKGRVLDVGSYDGRLLSELYDEFFDSITLHGVEPDNTVRPVINYQQWQEFGVVYLLGISFDLITMGHVLEHLPDPAEALTMCHEILSTNGLLFVEVPDLGSPQIQLEPYWTAQHQWYFSSSTLRALLAHAGFRVIEQESTGYGAIRMLVKKSKTGEIRTNPNWTRQMLANYEQDREKELARIGAILESVQGNIAVFGAGEHSRWLAKLFPATWDKARVILDSNPTKWDIEFLGHEPISPSQLPGFIDTVIISSYDTQDEMAQIINAMPGNRALKLYERVNAYDTWSP